MDNKLATLHKTFCFRIMKDKWWYMIVSRDLFKIDANIDQMSFSLYAELIHLKLNRLSLPRPKPYE